MTNPKFLVVDEKTSRADKSRPSEGLDEYFSGGVYPASANLSSRQIKKIRLIALLENLFPPDTQASLKSK